MKDHTRAVETNARVRMRQPDAERDDSFLKRCELDVLAFGENSQLKSSDPFALEHVGHSGARTGAPFPTGRDCGHRHVRRRGDDALDEIGTARALSRSTARRTNCVDIVGWIVIASAIAPRRAARYVARSGVAKARDRDAIHSAAGVYRPSKCPPRATAANHGLAQGIHLRRVICLRDCLVAPEREPEPLMGSR